MRVVVASAIALLSLPLWANAAVAVTHSELQAVDSSGAGTNPYVGTMTQVVLEGVVLNNPADMLDTSAGAPGGMGGQWQIFVQGLGDDLAGTALWMGQNYGTLPGKDPILDSYSDSAWLAEMDRLNDLAGHVLQMGDIIRITGYAMFRGGKTMINERHSIAPAMDFSIEYLGQTLPALSATPVSLASLQADVLCEGYDAAYPMFDASRDSGAEKYQGVLVRLEGVSLAGGVWGKDGVITVTDGEYTLPVRLGVSDDFLLPCLLDSENGFDVIGILNQENSNKGGYQLWVMGYDGSASTLGIVPEPTTIAAFFASALVLVRSRCKRR